MDKEHIVILLVGKTSSGKSSLIKKICDRKGYTQLTSYTTRPKRSQQDTDHIFVDVEQYLRDKESGDIIAETEIAGNYYYATRNQIYEADFYTVDPIGRDVLLSMDLPGIRFVTVYITCPDNLREERALKRGDNKHTYRVRNYSERQQFRRFVTDEQWNYAINNLDFAKSYSVLNWICDIEKLWANKEET